MNQLANQKMSLEGDCAIRKHMLSIYSQKLSSLNELKSMGFGFNKLRLLSNTIREIAAENGISYRIALEQFFGWVEKLYGGIKLRQKIQEQEQAEYAKLDNNLTATYPYYSAIKPFTVLPELSALEEQNPERQRQREQMRTSIYYSYRKIDTNSNTTEEESNQSDNDDHNGDIYEG